MRKDFPHPVTQIAIWVCLTILVQTMQSIFLPILATTLGLIAYLTHPKRITTLLIRTKWILLSILVVYAFLTPGEEFWTITYVPSPTREGLFDGMMQLSRLLSVLAGLSILLTSLSQDRLVSGLYVFSYPLKILGVSRERIAVRLALTLLYAERAMQETAKDWRSSIINAMRTDTNFEEVIKLPVQLLTWIDMFILVLISLTIIGLWR